jgi:hypothetical protein
MSPDRTATFARALLVSVASAQGPWKSVDALYQALVAENLDRSPAALAGSPTAVGGCTSMQSSLGNVTLCEDGVWIDDALVARRSAPLDALLGDGPPALAALPGGLSRHVQTRHYFGGPTEVGCAAAPQARVPVADRAREKCTPPITHCALCCACAAGCEWHGLAVVGYLHDVRGFSALHYITSRLPAV